MSDRIEDLFERFRTHGDAAALGRVFDGVAPELQRIARHLTHDAAEAEDLVQGTFLVAIEKRDTFDASRKLAPWLTGILLKQATLARRARSRSIEPDRLDSRASEDPLEAAGARELSEALTVALAKLSPHDREVLLPLLMDGRRAVEIARELGRRPDTVHMRIHRGLTRLRRLLPTSFGLAALIGQTNARGLSAVKAEVLRHARFETGIGGGAVAATSAGVLMSAKYWMVGVAAVAVGLAVGGWFILPESRDELSARSDRAGLEAALVSGPTGASKAKSPDETGVLAARSAIATSDPKTAVRAFELQVLRSDHEPAAGALIALVDTARVMSKAACDAAGACTFPPSTGIADAYIRDDASLPVHMRIDFAKGDRQTIELPAGKELSGRLLMSTDEALPDMQLELSTNSAPPGFAEAGPEVFEALGLMRYDSKHLVAGTKPGPRGNFRFQGLPDDWSGALTLPKELVFVVADKPTKSSERVFAVAERDVDLPVAYRPRVIGRLIDAVTRRPIANAVCDCTLEWSDGNDMWTGTRTGADGRFTIALDISTDAVGLEFKQIHAANGAMPRAKASPKWNGPCEPFDAGDIECEFPEARPIEFHAVDAQGAPIPSARAKISPLEIVTADERGVGTFAAVPLEADLLRVVAPGRRIASIPLTPDVQSPIEVVLAPANRLTISLPAQAAGRQDLQVKIASIPILFGGSLNRMYDSILRGGMIGRCWSADGDKGTREGRVYLAFGDDGRIVLEDIRPGVPFRVELYGEDRTTAGGGSGLIDTISIESLGPLEDRRIEFPASALGARRRITGRAIDADGQPILDAEVTTCIGCDSYVATTALDGSFHLDLAGSAPIDVEVAKRGYVPFRARGVNVESGRPIEARLLRSRDLRVEVVDTTGRPIEVDGWEGEIAGFGQPWKIDRDSTGVLTYCDLPPATIQVMVLVGGKKYFASHDTNAGTVRIVVPQHGRLEITWGEHSYPKRPNPYWLTLHPLGTEGVERQEWTEWRNRVPTFAFDDVLPGEYTIGLEADTPPTDGSTKWIYVAIHAPVHVTIEAGKTRKVELPPP